MYVVYVLFMVSIIIIIKLFMATYIHMYLL